jgi:hypothetical protein
MAERYSNEPWVMMELLNEPAGQDSKVWDKLKMNFSGRFENMLPKIRLSSVLIAGIVLMNLSI